MRASRLVGAILVLAAACRCGGSPEAVPRGARVVQGGCGSTVLYRGASPSWTSSARGPADLVQATADGGQVSAFLFGYPLRAGRPDNPANKILWVVRNPREGSDLAISGHPLGHGTPSVSLREPDNSGPGEIYPSIVDVPNAGCWRFTLRWHGNRDTIDLPYLR